MRRMVADLWKVIGGLDRSVYGRGWVGCCSCFEPLVRTRYNASLSSRCLFADAKRFDCEWSLLGDHNMRRAKHTAVRKIALLTVMLGLCSVSQSFSDETPSLFD